LLGHDGQDAAEVVQVPAVPGQRDQLLGERLDLLGLGQRGLDPAVLQQRGGQVAEEHPTVRRGPLELAAGIAVTHGRFNLSGRSGQIRSNQIRSGGADQTPWRWGTSMPRSRPISWSLARTSLSVVS